VISKQNICNIDIKERLGVITDLQHGLQIRRLRYFGHVKRMGQERHPHIALHGRVDRVRSRGRPRRRWLDYVGQDCEQRGKTLVEATRLAQNRQEWRSFVMKWPSHAQASPSRAQASPRL